MYLLRTEKPGLHPNPTCVHADRRCGNLIPGGVRKLNPRRNAKTHCSGGCGIAMLRKPGDLPEVCPTPQKFKRLATRGTLHGSRPNLRQRDPNGRIVPTPSDVLDKGASTKRCARKKKDNHTYIYTPEVKQLLHKAVVSSANHLLSTISPFPFPTSSPYLLLTFPTYVSAISLPESSSTITTSGQWP